MCAHTHTNFRVIVVWKFVRLLHRSCWLVHLQKKTLPAALSAAANAGWTKFLVLSSNVCLSQTGPDFLDSLGTGQGAKTDEFSENSQRGGGVIFSPKNYFADLVPLYRAFRKEIDFPKIRGWSNAVWICFRIFIRFGTLTRPLVSSVYHEVDIN